MATTGVVWTWLQRVWTVLGPLHRDFDWETYRWRLEGQGPPPGVLPASIRPRLCEQGLAGFSR
eukprot:7200145-Pyramimonas_sp.AAC.1